MNRDIIKNSSSNATKVDSDDCTETRWRIPEEIGSEEKAAKLFLLRTYLVCDLFMRALYDEISHRVIVDSISIRV